MQHALEADHIAAVSSIAARRSHVSDIVKHGLTWGLGHTATLFVFAGVAILLGRAIPETVAKPIEGAVGIMLIGLGAHVLWRLWRDRVHFHRHGHDDGTVHFHAHSHAGDTVAGPHVRAVHVHGHGFRWRTLLVGLMHGMAGSAALLVLAATQAASPAAGPALCRAVRDRLDDRHGSALACDRGAAGVFRALSHRRQSRAAGCGRSRHDRDRLCDTGRNAAGMAYDPESGHRFSDAVMRREEA